MTLSKGLSNSLMPESHIPKELHQLILRLTLALYRVTDAFPQHEVLRGQLRGKANEILESSFEYDICDQSNRIAASALAKIYTLQSFLEIARTMNFVRSLNIIVLKREYDLVARFFSGRIEIRKIHDFPLNKAKSRMPEGNGGSIVRKPPEPIKKKEISSLAEVQEQKEQDREIQENQDDFKESDFNERQLTILEFLSERVSAKISDLTTFFQNVSSKTIQRDLQDLVNKGILKKEGERRWTIYSLNKAV